MFRLFAQAFVFVSKNLRTAAILFWYLPIVFGVCLAGFMASGWLAFNYLDEAAWPVLVAAIILPIAFAVFCGHPATAWHRFVILGQDDGWPRIWPTRQSAIYGLKAIAFTFSFVVVVIAAQFIFHFGVLRVFFSDSGYPSSAKFYEFLLDQVPFGRYLFLYNESFAQVAINFIFLAVFGHWLLVLPESSLEARDRGARRFATVRRRWQMLGTLFLAYAIVPAINAIEKKLVDRI